MGAADFLQTMYYGTTKAFDYNQKQTLNIHFFPNMPELKSLHYGVYFQFISALTMLHENLIWKGLMKLPSQTISPSYNLNPPTQIAGQT